MARSACGAVMAWLVLSLVPPVWGEQFYLYSPRPVTPEETKDAKDAKDGVLVREVEVRQGDTLYGISRNICGRGMYYPQIILFNDIKNPDQIHAGDILKVPVTKGHPSGEKGTAPVHRKKRVAHKASRTHTAASTAVSSGTSPVTAKSSSGQLSELALDELKPTDRDKKKRAAAKQVASGGQKRVGDKGVTAAPPSASGKPAVAEGARPSVAPRPEQGSASATDAAAGQRLFERAIKAFRQDDCRTALELFDRYLTSYSNQPQAADASLHKAECYMKLSGQ